MSHREIRQLGKFDPAEHSARFGICCPEDEPCVVQQQFGPEVDVNTIVKRFGGGAPPRVRTDGIYGDFTGVHDFESAVERVEAAKRSFMSLDPEVRERFKNDPGRFLKAVDGMDVDELEDFVRPRKSVEVVPEGSPPAVSPSGGDSGGSPPSGEGGSGGN